MILFIRVSIIEIRAKLVKKIQWQNIISAL